MLFHGQLSWHDSSPWPIERCLTVLLFFPSRLKSSVSFTPFAHGCSSFLMPLLEHFRLLLEHFRLINCSNLQKIPAFCAGRVVCHGELDCLMEWSCRSWSQHLLISPTSLLLDCRIQCKVSESGAQVQALLLNFFLFNLPHTTHEACSRATKAFQPR